MAALKKCPVAVIVVLMALMIVSTASAQVVENLGVITCDVRSVVPIVRAEGIAELTGDITFDCENEPPSTGGTIVQFIETNLL